MDIHAKISEWNGLEKPFLVYYDAIDILSVALYQIRENITTFSEQELEVLRKIHLYTLEAYLNLAPKYRNPKQLEERTYFNDMTGLLARHNLALLENNPTTYDQKKADGTFKDIKEEIKQNPRYKLYSLNRVFPSNSLSESVYQQYEKLVNVFSFFPEFYEISSKKALDVDLEAYSKDLDLQSLIKSLVDTITTVPTQRDLDNCFYYIKEFGETEKSHEETLSVLFSRLIEKTKTCIELLSRFCNGGAKSSRKPTNSKRLGLTNSNVSNIIYGKSREKMIAEAKKTPYYLTTYTPDRIKEDQANLIAKWAMDTVVVKSDKKVFGSLAVMHIVPKEELSLEPQKEVKPITSSPVGNFDWFVWSTVQTNLKDFLGEKVEINFLANAFSVVDRHRGESGYTKSLLSSLVRLSNTWILHEYYEGTKKITIVEPLLSCSFVKERDLITGEEHEFFELHTVSEFYEKAEKLNQIMSFDEKLFKIEYYDKEGILTKLTQTKATASVVAHLLEHIYRFKYYYEHPRKTKDGKEEERGKHYNKILFETLFDLLEADDRVKKLRWGRRIEGCFQYWKSLNYIDYEIERKANQRGKSYDYILLKYPEAPEDTPKLSS